MPDRCLITWSPRAKRDLVNIRSYIAQFAPGGAERFAARLVATAESLQTHPERGRLVAGQIRELAVVSPYLIRYRVLNERVEIVRIRHGAQR